MECGERCGGVGVGGIGNGLAMPERGLTADEAVEHVVCVLGETRDAAAMGGRGDVVEYLSWLILIFFSGSVVASEPAKIFRNPKFESEPMRTRISFIET